jgi:carbamoyl-phosphate synthase large subunit
VTGAGGGAGIAVVQAVRRLGRLAVGVDSDPLAAGIRLADDGGTVPPYRDAAYVEELCRIATKTGAQVLISTLAEEVPVLWSEERALGEAGLRYWLPRAEAVENCTDKWKFACIASAAGVPAPPTGLGSADGVPGPWIVKPRFGRGSRDVYAVDHEPELRWALSRVPEPIVQTRLHGREFTVDVLVDRDGSVAGAVPRWRVETKAGISVKGETFEEPELIEATAALARAVGLEGPTNVQGFIADDGMINFIEVNPRFSGALPLSLAAGADLIGEYLRAIDGFPIRRHRLAYRAGVRMIRYHEELFEG